MSFGKNAYVAPASKPLTYAQRLSHAFAPIGKVAGYHTGFSGRKDGNTGMALVRLVRAKNA